MKKHKPQIKKVFSFVIDGECEIWYLQMLQKNENLQNINLEPKLPQKKKLYDQYKMVAELAEDSEKVFWIIDFDTISKETKEAKASKETPLQQLKNYINQISDNVIVVVNNPCLEFWFLLHYKQTAKYFASYDDLKKELMKYLPDYQKTQKYYKNSRQDIYQRLKPKLQTAISNAEECGKFDFENIQKGLSEMQMIFKALGL